MTNSHPNRTTPDEPGFRSAGVDELIKDVMRITPAPNASREAFVTVVNIVLAAIIVGILQPPALGVAVVAGVLGVFTVVRWVTGAKKWSGG